MSTKGVGLARALTTLVIASLSIVAAAAVRPIQTNVVRLGHFDAAFWGEQLRRELYPVDLLKPGPVFESIYGVQYPADRAAHLIAARFRGLVANAPPVGFEAESELPLGVKRIARVYGHELPILEQPTFLAPDLGVVGIAQEADIYPVLEEKTVAASLQNPLDPSPSLCGRWIRVRTKTLAQGWLLAAPCQLRSVVAVSNPEPATTGAGGAPAETPYPVIFIHGLASSADDAWGVFKNVLVNVGWRFGGNPEVSSGRVVGAANGQADFYTLNMSDWTAAFPSQGLSLEAQGLQVAAVVQSVRARNNARKVVLVGHSMGGLAARAYLQSLGANRYAEDVAQLITVGTPHLGARIATVLTTMADIPGFPIVENFLPVQASSVAVRELEPDSRAIAMLNTFDGATGLPPNVRYVTIGGTGDIGLALTKAIGQGDGVVSLASQLFLPGRRPRVERKVFEILHPVLPGPKLTSKPCLRFTDPGLPDLAEVHRCETQDANVFAELLRNLPPMRNVSQPPAEIVDRGACPYELCRYGEYWLARRDVDAYAEPPSTLGAALSSLQKKTVIPRGIWVTAVSGLVIAKRHEGRVDLVNRRTMYANGVTGAPPLVNGQVLPIYSYVGEDCYSTWIAGKTYPVCFLEPLNQSPGRPAQEWWVEVAAANGAKAWVAPSSGTFVSQEGLNGELGQVLADSTTGLQAKLLRVDILMREGADLNGGAGQYATAPLESVIETMDVTLLKAMISRGLDLAWRFCPASTAAPHALKPGGSAMLEALFANGMQLTCLQQPPLHVFLQTGIGLDSYLLDEAVKVAELLVKNGAALTARDYQNKTIFEVLDDPRWAARVAKLRQALLSMATAASASTAKPRGIAGRWYDGGPNCAETKEDQAGQVITLKIWYCNVGIENAPELVLRRSGETYADAGGRVLVRLLADDTLHIELRSSLKDKLGNETNNPLLWRPIFKRQ